MQIKCNGVYDLNDFKVDEVQEKMSIYLDTNIWYWLTYSGAHEEEQQPVYAQFAQKAFKKDEIQLLRSHLIYGELTHIIERDKYDEYKRRNNVQVSMKKFRQLSNERNSVVADIEASLNFMDRITIKDEDFIEVLNYISRESFVHTLRNTTLDGTDVLMAHFISQNDINNIVTDDGDFLSVRGINVFTYNARSIALAKKQNKILH